MVNYVGEEAFFKWYDSVSAHKPADRASLLNDVYQRYCAGQGEEYVLPASKTVSGKAEKYHFSCENIGCCGASTIYIYF